MARISSWTGDLLVILITVPVGPRVNTVAEAWWSHSLTCPAVTFPPPPSCRSPPPPLRGPARLAGLPRGDGSRHRLRAAARATAPAHEARSGGRRSVWGRRENRSPRATSRSGRGGLRSKPGVIEFGPREIICQDDGEGIAEFRQFLRSPLAETHRMTRSAPGQ